MVDGSCTIEEEMEDDSEDEEDRVRSKRTLLRYH